MSESLKSEFVEWWDRNYKGLDLESNPLSKSDMFMAWMDGVRCGWLSDSFDD